MDANVVMASNPLKYAVLWASWLWCVLAVIPFSDAGVSLWWQFTLIPSGILLTTIWFCLDSLPPVFHFKNRLVRVLWKSLPAVSLGAVLLGMTNIGLAVRVWLCEDELTAFAVSESGGDEPTPGRHVEKRVGLFYVDRTTGVGSEVTMITARGFGWSYGITYFPSGPPSDGYEHLFGPWYRFVDDW